MVVEVEKRECDNETFKLKITLDNEEDNVLDIREFPNIKFVTCADEEKDKILVNALNCLYNKYKNCYTTLRARYIVTELIIVPLCGKIIFYFSSEVDSGWINDKGVFHGNTQILDSDIGYIDCIKNYVGWGNYEDEWPYGINFEVHYEDGNGDTKIEKLEIYGISCKEIDI